jgi:hypothetical protein
VCVRVVRVCVVLCNSKKKIRSENFYLSGLFLNTNQETVTTKKSSNLIFLLFATTGKSHFIVRFLPCIF